MITITRLYSSKQGNSVEDIKEKMIKRNNSFEFKFINGDEEEEVVRIEYNPLLKSYTLYGLKPENGVYPTVKKIVDLREEIRHHLVYRGLRFENKDYKEKVDLFENLNLEFALFDEE